MPGPWHNPTNTGWSRRARFFTGFGLNILTNPTPATCEPTEGNACNSDADCTDEDDTCLGDCGFDGICCTDDDVPAISIPPQCLPFTTTSASTIVVNANNTSGAELPPGGLSVTGTPFTCNASGVPDTAAGAGLRTAAAFTDSTLGDIAASVTLNCE